MDLFCTCPNLARLLSDTTEQKINKCVGKLWRAERQEYLLVFLGTQTEPRMLWGIDTYLLL